MLHFLKNRLQALVKTPACVACRRFFSPEDVGQLRLLATSSLPATFCPDCLRHLTFRPWEPVQPEQAIYAATTLTPVLKHWIYGHKFYRQAQYADALASLPATALQRLQGSDALSDAVLTLVPPRPNSPAHFLPVAQKVAQQLHLPLETGLLLWNRHTTPQHQLTRRQERLGNMADALALDRQVYDRYSPKTRWVVLDDLTTTGATLTEALRAILAGEHSSAAAASAAVLKAKPLGLAIAHVPRE